MSKVINTVIDDGILRFTFTNQLDEIVSSFKMNPTDINLAQRCEEVSRYFTERKKNAEKVVDAEGIAKYNAELEEQFNYLLGYDASKELFSQLTATTILPIGSMFALVVLERIIEAVKPEMEKRKKKMQASVNKYTTKYHK